MLKKIFFVLLACSVVVHGAAITDGSLDGSFGMNGTGIVTTDFAGGSDNAFALILQPDGKLVAAGVAGSDFGLARYNADGSLDNSFGADGKVTTDFAGGSDSANALILQTDGKLVAAGLVGSTDFGLARYNADGSLDTSFGTNGLVTTDFGGTDQARALILQPDGKLVAAGQGASVFALARYKVDGSLDNSFGTNGKVTTDFAGGADSARALILQPDGKLVAAGQVGSDFALARYNADGSLDTSFGTNGKVTTDFGGSDFAAALILQPDGKLVAAGIAATDFGLARYNANGSLDTSFGTNGKVTTDFGGSDGAAALILQPDGKLVVAGIAAGSDFGLVRYNANGSLDTSFGTNGKVTTAFTVGTDEALALIVQPDGKLVAAGIAGNDFGLARYLVPSLEISAVVRDIRAKYRIVLPSDRNGTEYEL